MSKVDFTKPIRWRNVNNNKYAPANYIGVDEFRLRSDYKHIVRVFDEYRAVDADGRLMTIYNGVIENAPVTHKRWIVLWSSGAPGSTISSTTCKTLPAADDLRYLGRIIAIKEVTIEEGEGLHA